MMMAYFKQQKQQATTQLVAGSISMKTNETNKQQQPQQLNGSESNPSSRHFNQAHQCRSNSSSSSRLASFKRSELSPSSAVMHHLALILIVGAVIANCTPLIRQQDGAPEEAAAAAASKLNLDERIDSRAGARLASERARIKRAATARQDRLWDDAVIPYEIDQVFSEERAALFRSAMRHWENYTCIKFVERIPDEHRNYIVFTERSCGCCSFVGKRGNGAQAISIGKHCDKFGIVVHELGHVVGFWHEHTRPDRDQHVQIIGKNIMAGQEYNFNKLTKDEVNSLGLAYDYDSILHYATNTFAKDTHLDTILPLHGHLNTEEAATSAPSSIFSSMTGQQTAASNQMLANGTLTSAVAAAAASTGTADSSSISNNNNGARPTLARAQNSKQTNASSSSGGGPSSSMISDGPSSLSRPSAAAAIKSRLESDFQSMLQFDSNYWAQAAYKRTSGDGHNEQPKMMLLDGSVVVSVAQSAESRRRKRESLDVEDGLHMLAMDNLLAKTRPEIGQRVRLSVGDIAQTNLLYKCPKCGRTIQQTSGQFHSPGYYALPPLPAPLAAQGHKHQHQDRKLRGGRSADDAATAAAAAAASASANGEAPDRQSGAAAASSIESGSGGGGGHELPSPPGQPDERESCEWRLSVGAGERIMINITDMDLDPGAQTDEQPWIGLQQPLMNDQQEGLIDARTQMSTSDHHHRSKSRAIRSGDRMEPAAASAAASASEVAAAAAASSLIMANCLTDYIEIRDGYTRKAPLIARLCGHIGSLRDSIRPIVSSGNRLLVSYQRIPSGAIKRRGFSAQHETLCGAIILLGQSGASAIDSQQPLPHVLQSPPPPPLVPYGIQAATAATSNNQPKPQASGGGGAGHSPTMGKLNSNNQQQQQQSINFHRLVINGSSPSENEVLLSSRIRDSRYYHLQSSSSSSSQSDNNSSNNNSNSPETSTSGDQSRSSARNGSSSSSSPGDNNLTPRAFGWLDWPKINSSTIQSPNWPEHYRPTRECLWQVRAPENHQISMRFESFDLEAHDSCAYDYVEVRDGDHASSELIGRFCGSRAPDQILSSSSSLLVKFVSDSDVNRAGFLASLQPELDECKLGTHGCSYRCSNAAIPFKCECPSGLELAPDGKSCVPTCGGRRNESTGLITSPAFPDLYPINTKCVWEIIAPEHHRITLNFTHFDLEGIKSQECDYDFVDIRSRLLEHNQQQPQQPQLGKYINNGVFCGPAQPFMVTSVANIMRIEFNSDNSIQKSGFMAYYFIDKDECAINNGGCRHVCANTIGGYQCSCNNGFVLHTNKHDCIEGHCTHSINSPEGTFNSPNFPSVYQPNKECAWVFSTAPGHRIKLIFDQFDLESHSECAYDHVAVYDGESAKDPALGRYCGSRRPLTLLSSFNMLYLLFHSDATNEKRGFNATHSTVCGGRLQANLNQNDLIYSHPQFDRTTHYNRNEDCEWLIEANFNQRVRIEFDFFALEADGSCNYDQVLVYDGIDETSVQLARLCGLDIAKDLSKLTSSGESMLIVFRSDDSINNRGFSLVYTAIEAGDDEPPLATNGQQNPIAGATNSKQHNKHQHF